MLLSDHARGRDVPVIAWRPEEVGEHPVVVVSHGMGETGASYGWLAAHLAGRGYQVIAPTHFGSDRGVYEREGIRGIIAATRKPEIWQDRFRDISFLLDQVGVSGGGVAVVGHSAGALTACAVAGLQLGSVNFRDERVKAIVAMSMPRLTAVVANESWSTIDLPALHMTGTLDVSPQYWTFPRHRRIPFGHAASRGDQFLVTLRGASHGTYSAPIDKADRPTAQLQNCVARITELFLDGWLRDEPAARGSFTGLTCDGVTLERR